MEKTPPDRRIIVELKHTIDREDGIDGYLIEAGLLPWEKLQAQFQNRLKAERIFSSVSNDDIQKMIGAAKKLDATYRSLSESSEARLVDLRSCFVIRIPNDLDHELLIKILSDIPTVRREYLDPDTDVAFLPGDPLYEDQGYLHPAPKGIGVEAAWPDMAGSGAPGGDGEGARFIDVEYGWDLDNIELKDRDNVPRVKLIGNPPGVNSSNPDYKDHGTKTLAIILALDNNKGGVGVAPHVSAAHVVSIKISETEVNRPDAILYAVSQLGFGEVLVLPLQIGGTFLPIESVPLDFSIIRLATALGITVVEAAGNGGFDLDNPAKYPNPSDWNVLRREHFDSNAVMVGASESVAVDGTYRRYSESNFGTRIDCFAWGENVRTLENSVHNGSSAACAIVAGAAIVVQGVMRKKRPPGLGPVELRKALQVGGTPCACGEGIEVMPNLCAILQGLDMLPDIYMRDFIGDDGSTHEEVLFSSPDIIIRSQQEADPQQAFGEGSGKEDGDALSMPLKPGVENYIYVRVRNRGSVAGTVRVHVYKSPVGTVLDSRDWLEIGSVDVANVPVGDSLVVSDAILWTPPPEENTYGLIAWIALPSDAPIYIPVFRSGDHYRKLVGNNRTIAVRNFHLVPNLPSSVPGSPDGDQYVSLPFSVSGTAGVTQLQVEAQQLPGGSKIYLEAPLELLSWMNESTPTCDEQRSLGWVSIPGGQWLGEATFPRDSSFDLRLLVQIPEVLRIQEFELYVNQFDQDNQVGRVSWRLIGS
jgi:serine protease